MCPLAHRLMSQGIGLGVEIVRLGGAGPMRWRGFFVEWEYVMASPSASWLDPIMWWPQGVPEREPCDPEWLRSTLDEMEDPLAPDIVVDPPMPPVNNRDIWG